MSSTTFAREFAACAHEGQKDLAGKPYMEHICAVAAGVNSEEAKTVAYLHDVVEDTDYTLDDLSLYFPAHIVEAVDHLTRRKGELYANFIQRVKQNSLATEVKISDLLHNMRLSRLKNPTQKDFRRIDKYRRAYRLLTQGENIGNTTPNDRSNQKDTK
jgi:(p)ppGpp synthase/HD superfamily hydrolase